jgi:hypothetical protein
LFLIITLLIRPSLTLTPYKSKPFDMEIERILSDDEINALLKGFEK